MQDDKVPNDTHFLDIDADTLDKALVEQPALFFKHSKRLADARLALDEAESAFDVTKAELSLMIRDFPKKFGLGDKVTEGSVNAVLSSHESCQKAQRKIHRCKHNVELLSSMVKALDHRKRALEKLVDLHGQNYFSSPRVAGEEARSSLDHARTKQMVKKTRRKKEEPDDDE